MLFCNITILDEQFAPRAGQFVGVRDGRIAYIGERAPSEDYGERYDGKNKLLMPGFVNAHGHTSMTLLRGYAENLALHEWLNRKVFPFEAKLTTEMIYQGALLGAAEMIRTGTVSVTDMYLDIGAVARAMDQSGLRANVCCGPVCFDEGLDFQAHPVYAQTERAYRDWHGAGNGRIRLDMSIHAEYTSTPRLVRQIAEKASEWGLNIHLHLSETQKEQEECKERRGMTPAEYFLRMGVLDRPVNAAHCVWLEGEDFDILAEKKVTTASNPVSNLKLASGFCNAARLLEKGVNLAIGTDGAASNNSLDMLEEMRIFATLQKAVSKDPTFISPQQALYAATRAGAIGQGREDCGLLKEGFRADLIALDLQKPWYSPGHNLAGDVVYAGRGTDVCLTMVDGKVLYRDGVFATLDYEKITSDASHAAKAVLAQL